MNLRKENSKQKKIYLVEGSKIKKIEVTIYSLAQAPSVVIELSTNEHRTRVDGSQRQREILKSVLTYTVS